MDSNGTRPKATKKFWITYDRESNITSIIRYVDRKRDGNYVVAVSRAYLSPEDNNFSRKIGRDDIAMDRMHRFLKTFNFIKNKKNAKPFIVKTHYAGKPEKARFPGGCTVFFIGGEEYMSLHELNVWHNTVLPAIERELH